MWFHFCFANHHSTGILTTADMRECMMAGLMELGHKVTFDENQFAPGAINVIFEHHVPGFAKKLFRSKLEYGIVSSEIFDGKMFNWKRDDFWIKRWKDFKKLSKKAKFIWTADKNAVYDNLAPTGYFEPGYSDLLLPKDKNITPNFDFVFFGLPSPYRSNMIDRLRKHASVLWPDHILSIPELETAISSAKIGLHIKPHPEWPWPSGSRLSRLILAGRDIVAEPTKSTSVLTLHELISFVPEGVDFVDFALSRLAGGDWKKEAEDRLEQFKQRVPLKNIMEKMLDDTLYSRSSRKQRQGHGDDDGLRQILGHFRPPVFVKSVGCYNIVFFKDEYFVVPQSLGGVDLQGKNVIKKHNLQSTKTLQGIDQLINEIECQWC